MRRAAWLLVLSACLVTGGGRAGGAAPPPAVAPPNLLLVTLDTTRADHIGCYGDAGASTPNLDALSKAGTTFTEMHAHVPLTLPSHANILTGRLPPSLNLRVNGLRLREGTPTLATLLKKRGYSTCAAVSAVVIDRTRGMAEGFEAFDDAMNLGPRGGGPPEERRAEDTTRAALKAVQSAKGPFFLWVHYYDPHYDYRPPEPFAKRFAKSPYDGEIAYMDQQFGALVAALRKEGKMDNTLLVVCGDHGEGLMEFGEKQHGVFVYEPMMRVPCWLVFPGRVPAGKKVESLCGLTDLAPTIGALMGFSIPSPDGVDLAPAIRGQVAGRQVYLESYHGYFTYGWAPLRGVMTSAFKYIESPKSELYDWRKSEKANLLKSKPSESNALSQALKKYPEADKGEREQMENLLKDPSNAETLRQLMSLGYLSGKGQRPDQAGLLDPKDAIGIEDELHRAQELIDEGKADAATTLLLSILKRNPANVPALSILGGLYLGQKQYDKARVCFEEEIKLKPQMDTAHLNLGTVFKRQGKVDLAMKEYRAALALNPRFAVAVSSLASLLNDQKKNAEARAVLEEGLKNGAESGDIFFLLGVAEATAGNWEKARYAFTRSISLEPTRHEAMANLGRIAFQQGKVDEAVTQYERALRLDSRNASYLATLGSLYLNGKEDPDRALHFFSRALAADPYGPEAGKLRELVRDLQASQKR